MEIFWPEENIHIKKPLFKYRVKEDSRSFKEAKKFQQDIKKYVYNKHSEVLFDYYSNLMFDKIKWEDSFEFKIGNILRKMILKMRRLPKRD